MRISRRNLVKLYPKSSEVTCALCKVRAWKTMMRRLDGVWVCKSCWDKLLEEIHKREIRKELVRKGVFNPSER